MGPIARTCLPAAIALGIAIAPGWVEAASKRASSSKTVKTRSTKKPAKKKIKKVTAKTIARWQKQKMPSDQIVAKAIHADYKVTKLEKKKLLKYKVKKPLIAQLESAQKGAPASSDTVVADASPPQKQPLKFDPNKTMDPNDIDFDSVPPPKGMPSELAKKQKDEAEKKPTAPAAKSDDKKEKRVVIAAGK